MATSKKNRSKLFPILPNLITQIYKSKANKNESISKVKYMRNRVVELSARTKKVLPLKEEIRKHMEEKEKKKYEKRMKINKGLLMKKRRK